MNNNNRIEILDTGILYRNPTPHVHSVQAYFPSVVMLDNGELLCSIVLGEAFEATNLSTHICRSRDGGETWELEGAIGAQVPQRLTSNAARLTALPNGEVAMFMIRHDRSEYSQHGLTNPETLGFVPVELLLLRSFDYGRTWNAPSPIAPPLVGPAFEMCSPITPLRDGRWLLPTQTWPGWNGECENGIKMIALVSHDQGQSWPEYLDVMSEAGNVYFWESKIVEYSHGALLAVAWVYDDDKSADRPDHFAISQDGGRTWSRPATTGLAGQTMTPILADDESILSVYRRVDSPGLWANLSHLETGEWINDSELPLWGNQSQGLVATSENMSENFTTLRFGAPSICRLENGDFFVAFWCYEEMQSVIRWFKLRVA